MIEFNTLLIADGYLLKTDKQLGLCLPTRLLSEGCSVLNTLMVAHSRQMFSHL